MPNFQLKLKAAFAARAVCSAETRNINVEIRFDHASAAGRAAAGRAATGRWNGRAVSAPRVIRADAACP
jgi:hypothetical protein